MNTKLCKDCKHVGAITTNDAICGFENLSKFISDTYPCSDNEFAVKQKKFGCTFWESMEDGTKKSIQEPEAVPCGQVDALVIKNLLREFLGEMKEKENYFCEAYHKELKIPHDKGVHHGRFIAYNQIANKLKRKFNKYL